MHVISRKARWVTAVLLLSTLDPQLARVLAQGSLTPPGIPAPTMKTLAQIEPRTPISSLPFSITAAGAYYLTANLSPGANQNGIVVAADNVVIDLCGFTLTGGGGGSGEGISASGARTNIVVRNGTVRSWPGSGINFHDSGSSQVIVQSVGSISNTFTGIALRNGSRAVDCVASGNSQRGFLVDNDCLVEQCKAAGNLTAGIAAGAGCRLTANQATGNATGLAITGTGNIVANNIVKTNTDNYNLAQGNQIDLLLCQLPESIDWPARVKLVGSLTGLAGQHGITIDSDDVEVDLGGFTLLGVAGSLDGISVFNSHSDVAVHGGSVKGWGGAGANLGNARNCRIYDLIARNNGGDGMRGGERTTVQRCVAETNGAVGIAVAGTSSIRDCSAAYNANGIASSSAQITGCNADYNTGRGISSGSSSVVSDCSAFANGTEGFFCNGSGSIIRHCSATSNTGDGIHAFGDILVLENECDSNGQGAGTGAGIHFMSGGPGTGGRIQGNNVTDNDTGIKVDTAGHFITQNTAQGNTLNYVIVASNKVGVIVASPNSVAISGSTGGAGVGSTDPWANFSY